MTDRFALIDLLDKTAQAVSQLGVLMREQAQVLRAEWDAGDKMLTISEACDALNCGRTLLRGLIQKKQIQVTRVGRRPRISAASLRAYEERKRGA